MKILSTIVGIFLGLLFLVASVPILLHLPMPEPKLPEGTPMAAFMGVMGSTGYMTFVKVCELIGGILVMIPRTRNFGLLVLGPIIVNILAFWAFIAKAVPNGLTIAVVMFAAYLLWCGRKAFAGLLKSRNSEGDREKTAGKGNRVGAAFIQAAIAADDAWMEANDRAQLAAMTGGDKVEWKRLFDERGERLRLANQDMTAYFLKYYSYLQS